MVNLLELPKNIFDAIIAAYFEDYISHTCWCRHSGISPWIQIPHRSEWCDLAVRCVHSRFKTAADPYIFQEFRYILDQKVLLPRLCTLLGRERDTLREGPFARR